MHKRSFIFALHHRFLLPVEIGFLTVPVAQTCVKFKEMCFSVRKSNRGQRGSLITFIYYSHSLWWTAGKRKNTSCVCVCLWETKRKGMGSLNYLKIVKNVQNN